LNRVVNFNAGPSTLPLEVLEQIRDEIVDFKGEGLSIIEASHRSKMYEDIHNQTIELIKELYKIPNNFKVLFLQGGASLQFAMVPMNLYMGGSVEFVDTGNWSSKAINEAKVQNINYKIVASSKDTNYDRIPDKIEFSNNLDYAYITSNNTIYGTEYREFPKTNSPLVVDASSDIFSYPIDWKRVGVLFAGAQKNAGVAGVTVVIIREDLIKRENSKIPIILRYKTFADKNSLYNTPPVFAIYVQNLILKWIKRGGGIEKIAQKNRQKAQLLYSAIDNSKNFFVGHAQKESRSLMNVTFNIKNSDGSNSEILEKKFIKEAQKEGMIGLKGHRSIGGLRASLYNAMSIDGVKKLVEFMEYFQQKNS